MVTSKASTVDDYLDELDDDRRAAISEVRGVILEHLPEGFVETMAYGMPTYEVALEHLPADAKQPIMLAALASQKRHMAVYLTSVYADPSTLEWFRARYIESGKKLDMGKSCVRFTKLEHLPLDLVGEAIGKASLDATLAGHGVADD